MKHTKDEAYVEIEMLESVIAEAAEKIIHIKNSQNLLIKQFYDLLEEERAAEFQAAIKAFFGD